MLRIVLCWMMAMATASVVVVYSQSAEPLVEVPEVITLRVQVHALEIQVAGLLQQLGVCEANTGAMRQQLAAASASELTTKGADIETWVAEEFPFTLDIATRTLLPAEPLADPETDVEEEPNE